MTAKPMTSEVSGEGNTDKMVQRAAELGIPYDAARAIYSEAFHDGFGNYAALKAELEQWKVDCGREFEARIKAQAENERLKERLKKNVQIECEYRAKIGMCEGLEERYELAVRAEKSEAELAELRAKCSKCPFGTMLKEYEEDDAALAAKEPGKEGRKA